MTDTWHAGYLTVSVVLGATVFDRFEESLAEFIGAEFGVSRGRYLQVHRCRVDQPRLELIRLFRQKFLEVFLSI